MLLLLLDLHEINARIANIAQYLAGQLLLLVVVMVRVGGRSCLFHRHEDG